MIFDLLNRYTKDTANVRVSCPFSVPSVFPLGQGESIELDCPNLLKQIVNIKTRTIANQC